MVVMIVHVRWSGVHKKSSNLETTDNQEQETHEYIGLTRNSGMKDRIERREEDKGT